MKPDFLINDRSIFLTRTERQIYDFLKAHPEKTLSDKDIQIAIWGKPRRGNAVAVYINYLRGKLGKGVIGHRRGYGYYLISE